MLGEILPEPLQSTLCPLSGPFPAYAIIFTCHNQTALRKGPTSFLLMSPRFHAEVWTVKQVWNLRGKRFWTIWTNTNPKTVQSNEIFPSLLWKFRTALNADCCHREDGRDFDTPQIIVRNTQWATWCSYEILLRNKSPGRSFLIFLSLRVPHGWTVEPQAWLRMHAKGFRACTWH